MLRIHKTFCFFFLFLYISVCMTITNAVLISIILLDSCWVLCDEGNGE